MFRSSVIVVLLVVASVPQSFAQTEIKTTGAPPIAEAQAERQKDRAAGELAMALDPRAAFR